MYDMEEPEMDGDMEEVMEEGMEEDMEEEMEGEMEEGMHQIEEMEGMNMDEVDLAADYNQQWQNQHQEYE